MYSYSSRIKKGHIIIFNIEFKNRISTLMIDVLTFDILQHYEKYNNSAQKIPLGMLKELKDSYNFLRK